MIEMEFEFELHEVKKEIVEAENGLIAVEKTKEKYRN